MHDNQNNSDIKIMLVEDEAIIAKDIENILLDYGFNVVGTFSRAEDAINKVIDLQPNLILMDIVLKGEINGIEAAKKINSKIHVPIIYLTAYADDITIKRIVDTVPYGYFLKPFEEKELFTWINTTIHKFKIDKELNLKLQKAERDLKQIEYIASHDLQEPLRMVASYVRLLQKKYHGKIDKDADEFIGFVVDGVKRMKDLINDLLEYSRINYNNYKPEITDLNKLVEEEIKQLGNDFKSKSFDVSYNELPIINVDKHHFHTLFYNLLSNALKFNESDFCKVTIECTQDNEILFFRISDNGIGIDNQYSQKIFDIFQKLHDNNQYEGTGIGLAICRKIVEFYKGELWLDSHRGKGTTFNFTLQLDGKYSSN